MTQIDPSGFDPLALRHGPLIAEIWTQIAHARAASRQGIDQEKAAFWRKRIRRLSSKVRDAQRREMAQSDASTASIDLWFEPVATTLTKAETHFATLIAKHAIETAKAAPTLR